VLPPFGVAAVYGLPRGCDQVRRRLQQAQVLPLFGAVAASATGGRAAA
jgi:hypothetical protein